MSWFKRFFHAILGKKRRNEADLLQLDRDFAYWAFGNAYNAYLVHESDAIDLCNAWNQIHPDLLPMRIAEGFTGSISKMVGYWAEAGYPGKNWSKINDENKHN